MTENLELYLKIVTTVAGIFIAYHKFIMSELNKKMDRDDCGRQQEILAEKREKLETLIEERTKTQFNQLKDIKEDLKIIKEHITKNGGNYDR